MNVVLYMQLEPFSLPLFYHLLKETGLMHMLKVKTIKMQQISTPTSSAALLLHNEEIIVISIRKLKT